jgi:hypothetical protein
MELDPEPPTKPLEILFKIESKDSVDDPLEELPPEWEPEGPPKRMFDQPSPKAAFNLWPLRPPDEEALEDPPVQEEPKTGR